MPYEIRGEVRKWATGTIVHPKYEVYDRLRSTSFTLASAVWTLYDEDGNAISGMSDNCIVRNNDTDLAGNTIKTIEGVVDLRSTDIVEGSYQYGLHVTFSSGETDDFVAPIKIKEYP